MSYNDTDEEYDNDMQQEERYVEDREMSVGYYKAIDVFSFLRKPEDLSAFFHLLFNEHIKTAKYIDANGGKLFYPIIYLENIYTYGVDYQFFIYALAKFISSKFDNDEFIFRRVLRDYALLNFNIKSPISLGYRRLLMTFFESVCLAVNNSNYMRPMKYFEIDVPRLIEFNNKIILHKTVCFNKVGLSRYIDLEEFIEENKRYFIEEEQETIVWGKIKVKNYLQKNQIQKYNYFTLNITRKEYDKSLTFEESYKAFL